MENWILVVGYNRPHFEAAQKEWLKFNILLHSVDTTAEAIDQINARQYLAVIASYSIPDIAPLFDFMSEVKQIPLVVLSQEDSGTKMAESIIRGADTFIIDPDKLIESIKKNQDILDRLSKLSHHNKQALGILTHRDIFMLVGYRKVFVRGPSQIANLLTAEKVLNPVAYHHKEGRNLPRHESKTPHHWRESSIVNILERREYTGCIVNFKTYTNSIWDKKQRENPIENHAVFYNTHPAIIEQEVFDKVQELRGQRHRKAKTGKTSLFSGLAYCADCKKKLYYSTTNYFEKRQDFFTCSTHRHYKGECSGHYIRAVVLEELVWMHMQEVISYVTQYEAHFRGIMERELRLTSDETIRVCKKRLTQAEKRLNEIDRHYEDNVSSKISDERFAMMSKGYEDEQSQLTVDVQTLEQEIDMQERQIENLDQFVQHVGKYAELQELTPYALRELVKAIYVEAPDKSSGKRRQSIHICYDLVGFIPLDTLMKRGTA